MLSKIQDLQREKKVKKKKEGRDRDRDKREGKEECYK